MPKHLGGLRRKTRHKLSKNVRAKGKISLTSYFQKFEVGDKVVLVAEPAVHKGMYHPNHYGRAGVISEKLPRCYKVQIMDKNKQKELIVHPVHLKRA